jgi:hypothetical protein
MFVSMLHPKFKNMWLMTNYMKKNVTTLLVTYDENPFIMIWILECANFEINLIN